MRMEFAGCKITRQGYEIGWRVVSCEKMDIMSFQCFTATLLVNDIHILRLSDMENTNTVYRLNWCLIYSRNAGLMIVTKSVQN